MTAPMMPSEIDDHLSVFDRFAAAVSTFAAKPPFFIGCVLLILVWPVCFVFLSVDTAQLVVNTATTIVTFLMVALLQNSSHRADLAIQHKLNAIADALGDLMCDIGDDDAAPDVHELKQAVGLEQRESSS